MCGWGERGSEEVGERGLGDGRGLKESEWLLCWNLRIDNFLWVGILIDGLPYLGFILYPSSSHLIIFDIGRILWDLYICFVVEIRTFNLTQLIIPRCSTREYADTYELILWIVEEIRCEVIHDLSILLDNLFDICIVKCTAISFEYLRWSRRTHVMLNNLHRL